MSNSVRWLLGACSAVATLLAVAGCAASGSLLSDLRLSAQVIAPTGAGETPTIAVAYTLSRPATVSAYLDSESGERLYLRQNEQRPVAGNYVFAFNGSYSPDPTRPERRVLPSGSYNLVMEARDGAGLQQQSTARLAIRDADTALPTIEALTLFPETISPNSDGIDDLVRISYRTTKTADVTRYLLANSGKRYLLERNERLAPGEHATSWDGQIGNQLLPTGDYRIIVEAQDRAGNVAVAERNLRLDSSSMPDAHLLAVSFTPQRLVVGGTVRVEIRVKNTGNTVLRTQGPDPGYSYRSAEGFGTIEGGAFGDKRGYWRVGVDWAVAPGATGSKYPYRWGFGKDLQPGEEATVVGYIRIEQRSPRIWLFAGLVQEQVRYWDNEVGRTAVEISY